MSRARLHGRACRLAPLAATALLWLSACEESELPSAPAGRPSFTAIAFDRTTLQPVAGTTFAAGGAAERTFTVDVRYQRTPEEIKRLATASLQFYIETFDSIAFRSDFAQFFWEGDLTSAAGTAKGDTGTIRFTGKFRVPTATPLCGSYDYLRIIAVMEPEVNLAYRDQSIHRVTGAREASSTDFFNCVYGTAETDKTAGLRWGEPLWVFGRRLPYGVKLATGIHATAPGMKLVFAGAPDVAPAPYVFVSGQFTDVFGWVPIGARSGDVRMKGGVREVAYGSDTPPTITVATDARDFFEPNDTIGSPGAALLSDISRAFLGVLYAYNPALTLPAHDRESNPYKGWEAWGKGDWFRLRTTRLTDVCVYVDLDQSRDNTDLFVFNQGGNLVASSFTNFDEGVRLNGVPANTTLFVWVTPRRAAMTTANGAYVYEAGDCAVTGGADGAAAGLAAAGAAAQSAPSPRPAAATATRVW